MIAESRPRQKVSFKRRIAQWIERLSGNLVVPPSDIPSLSEHMQIARLFRHLKVDCVFDVGANDGQYAAMLRHGVGYRGPIISYEPIPDLAARMAGRIAELAPWFVEPLALDREAGSAVFHIAEADQFSSLHRPAADQHARMVEQIKTSRDVMVQRATLATELDKWRTQLGFRRPFLKMDTQGNEMAIVEGAGDHLTAFVGIQTELAIRPLYDDAPGYAQMLGALQARGFEPSGFLPSNAAHFPGMFDVDCLLYNTAADIKT